jgi:Entericidin EcnA/B family
MTKAEPADKHTASAIAIFAKPKEMHTAGAGEDISASGHTISHTANMLTP